MQGERTYMCIDLKSYYASVECMERGRDPLTTNLVVADSSRTDRTICLAVSPSLKALGVPGRPRLFEAKQKIAEINRARLARAPRHRFTGKSTDAEELKADPSLELDYIVAPPQMNLYMRYSGGIYGILLRYVAKEHIHVYSIDESFLDVTQYMGPWKMDAKQFAQLIMGEILHATGITATCGIGPNLYLAKVALDIISKHTDDHIGILTEESYREKLWDHRPLTDFWMVGNGISTRLARVGLRTMRDVATMDERWLYKEFGINAQLLIDHAWGRESTTMADIKSYVPREQSLSSGQVLHTGYNIPGAKLLIMEMAELLSLELVDKGLSTSSITITLAYSFSADIKPAHGTISTDNPTSSTKRILEFVSALYDRVAKYDVPVYHVGICFNKVRDELSWQYHIFATPQKQEQEKALQKAIIDIKRKYGKNGIFKGMNLLEGAKTIERNSQVGGHRSG